MEKDLVNKIIDKKYSDLSVDELNEIQSFCANEDEFNQMKEVFTEVEALNFTVPIPKRETKQSLDALFDEKYAKVAPVWYMSIAALIIPKDKPIHRQPLMQVAAVCLLLLLSVPFFKNDIISPKKEQLAKVDVVKEIAAVPTSNKDKAIEVDNNEELELETAITSLKFDTKAIQKDEGISIDNTRGNISANNLSFTAFASAEKEEDFVHSDFIEMTDEENVDYSITAADVPDVLDLLTTAF